jgi:RNA polymerase sigma-70 factor (ECF subfamily)
MTGQDKTKEGWMTSEEFSERIVAMMPTLYRVSCSQLTQSSDREDAVQECLCKAWKKRQTLRDERFMQTWVVRILINECQNIRKQQSRELPVDELPEVSAPASEDLSFELREALLSLKQSLCLPIVLHYIEGFSTKEVAHILRLPQGTVKSRMSRGRLELRKLLSEGDL